MGFSDFMKSVAKGTGEYALGKGEELVQHREEVAGYSDERLKREYMRGISNLKQFAISAELKERGYDPQEVIRERRRK
ncbi:hypothetical protein ACTQ5K_25265 [Niallia sp. Sow4_A1]|uniref:hypothetical protein n=1 Tax=Niallia sp. Sow4_A1 TaxID=3438793 RepID=UPI003F9C7C29